HYTGIEVQNVFQLGDSSYTHDFTDSIEQKFLPHHYENGYVAALPTYYELAFKSRMSDGFFVTVGTIYRTNIAFSPMMFLKFDRQIRQKFMVGANLSVGGWGGWNAGIQ